MKSTFHHASRLVSHASFEPFARVAIRQFCIVAVSRRMAPRVQGLEFIPPAGPVLLAGRHYHHFWDAAILLTSVRRPLHFLVALDWVHASRERRLMEWACRAARWPALLRPERVGVDGGVYRPEDLDPYVRRAARDAVELLRQDRALVVFPEGYPTVDPEGSRKHGADAFLPFRAGFVRLVVLAQRTGSVRIPIVPFGLAYQPAGGPQVLLRIGAPTYLQPGTDPEALAAVVEARVRSLSAPLSRAHVPAPSTSRPRRPGSGARWWTFRRQASPASRCPGPP